MRFDLIHISDNGVVTAVAASDNLLVIVGVYMNVVGNQQDIKYNILDNESGRYLC